MEQHRPKLESSEKQVERCNPASLLADWYSCLEQMGVNLIGDPKTAFAVFDSNSAVVRVYVKDSSHVEVVHHPAVCEVDALRSVQAAGGAFYSLDDNDVVCILHGLVIHGVSYGDAAIRAMNACLEVQNHQNVDKFD